MLGREVGVSTRADTMTSDVNVSYFTSLWALFHLFTSRAEENIKNFKAQKKSLVRTTPSPFLSFSALIWQKGWG